jgi:hypothetical protein
MSTEKRFAVTLNWADARGLTKGKNVNLVPGLHVAGTQHIEQGKAGLRLQAEHGSIETGGMIFHSISVQNSYLTPPSNHRFGFL